MLIIIAVASVLLLLLALLSVMLLLACFKRRRDRQRRKGIGKVGSKQENISTNQQQPQDHDTLGNYQLQQNEAYGTSIDYIPGRQRMAMMMTINAAYGSVTGNGHSNVVHSGENMAENGRNTAPELDEENEEYHYYY